MGRRAICSVYFGDRVTYALPDESMRAEGVNELYHHFSSKEGIIL